MYSQGREEEILVQLLNAERSVGHFLDIGAYDGKTFSNTLRLVELGWTGVCVEPSPSVFQALLKLHKDNPKVVLLNSAVCENSGFIDFYDSGGDAISTTDTAHKAKWEAGWKVNYAKFTLFAISYAELFRQYGTQFDFINLDVEGQSANMFLRLPLQSLVKTRLICVEHDGLMDEIKQHGAKFGFSYVWHSGENIILHR